MDKQLFKKLIKVLIGIGLVLGVWYLVMCECIEFGMFSPKSIRDYVQSFKEWAVLVYIIGYALNTISVFPPIAMVSIAAGLIFGKVWGAIYLLIGAIIGTTATFFISRFFGRGLVEKITKGHFKKLDAKLEEKGFLTVLFFRVVPLIPYEVLNYVSGLTKIKFKDYFFATLLGLLPGVIISAFFGGALGEIDEFADLFTLEFGLALLGLVILILIPVIYQKVKKNKKKRREL